MNSSKTPNSQIILFLFHGRINEEEWVQCSSCEEGTPPVETPSPSLGGRPCTHTLGGSHYLLPFAWHYGQLIETQGEDSLPTYLHNSLPKK